MEKMFTMKRLALIFGLMILLLSAVLSISHAGSLSPEDEKKAFNLHLERNKETVNTILADSDDPMAPQMDHLYQAVDELTKGDNE
jgi:hypothetical protein